MKLYDPAQVQPKQPEEPTPQNQEPKPLSYRLKNWWHYHKWYVICGIILFWILGDIIIGVLTKKEPDFQIAYVGEMSLPEDTISALEQAFAELAGDFNGDGKVIVQINQYTTGAPVSEEEMTSARYTSQVLLTGDITACESYFFLTDDPEGLQKGFQILANPDGSWPDESDYSVEDKVVLWTDCPALAEMELGSYSIVAAGSEMTGDNQELLSGLYLGRRYFYTDKTVDSVSQCNALWDTIIHTKDVQKQ